MPINLRSRNFLKELDFEPAEWTFLLQLAAELKRAKRCGSERPRLAGRNIALVFDGTSTQTRCAFEVAAHDQAAHITYVAPEGSQLGRRESVADTARALGRLFDGIEYRGMGQHGMETLGRIAGVPVWNGWTDTWHPTQSLCDIFTMREHSPKRPTDVAFAFCGDARGSTANSLLVAGAMAGMDVRVVAPRAMWNDADVIEAAQCVAADTDARVTLTEDVDEGVRGVDFVYTDAWAALDEPKADWEPRVRPLRGYQVDMDLLRATGNPDVKFMRCLPAYRRRRTALGEEVYTWTGVTGLDVTDEVFRSRHSIVFDQAENRVHAIKAVLVATLGG
jgi:ornithine carbamoyltransferase